MPGYIHITGLGHFSTLFVKGDGECKSFPGFVPTGGGGPKGGLPLQKGLSKGATSLTQLGGYPRGFSPPKVFPERGFTEILCAI